jgi:TonB family protein
MDILHLSLWGPSLGAAAGAQQGNCADASPSFLLIPAPPLPLRRVLQGLGVDVVLLLIGLALAGLFSRSAAEQATFNPAQPYEKPIQITFYNPNPAKRRAPDVSLSGVKGDEGRRFSPSLKTIHPAAAPALDPLPTLVATRADLAVQVPEKWLLLRPMPPAILQIRVGAPKAPATPLPSLDPRPPRAAAFSQHGTNADGDPLGARGSAARLADQDADAERERPQPQHPAFTKPEISFMPKPMYPPAALAARIEGDVILQVTFDKSGRVIFRRFIRQLQNAEMNSVARETVERIKFVPAMRNRVPVDSDSVIRVFFRLTQLNMTATF